MTKYSTGHCGGKFILSCKLYINTMIDKNGKLIESISSYAEIYYCINLIYIDLNL